jgi:hypothetical protein
MYSFAIIIHEIGASDEESVWLDPSQVGSKDRRDRSESPQRSGIVVVGVIPGGGFYVHF